MLRALRWLFRYGLAGPDYDAPGWWPHLRRLLAFAGLCGLGVMVGGVAGLVHAAVVILAGGP